jgi:hypothetical protein
MRILLAIALLGLLGARPAGAAPLLGDDDLRRNGAVSRHLWSPDAASVDVAGIRVSAGLAVGLRGPLRSQLGTPLAPAIHFALDSRSGICILSSGRRGAAILWQVTN